MTVLAVWRAILRHRIVETLSEIRGFSGRGVACLPGMTLGRTARRNVRTRKMSSVVGVMRGGRRRSSVVEGRPPGRWTGIMVHYRRTSMRIAKTIASTGTFVGHVDGKVDPKPKTQIKQKQKHNPIYYTGYRFESNRRRLNDNERGGVERAVTAVRVLDGQERRIPVSAESAFERLKVDRRQRQKRVTSSIQGLDPRIESKCDRRGFRGGMPETARNKEWRVYKVEVQPRRV